MSRTFTWLQLPATAIAGVLLSLGYPPYEWTFLAGVGLVAFVWVVSRSETLRMALWSGYVFGLAYFAIILSWLIQVELIAYYPLVMVQALAFLFIAGAVFRFRHAPSWMFVLGVAGASALAEFVRVRWPFGGFPWGSIGVMVGATPLRPSAQWIGATGWGVVLAAVAALAVMAVRRRCRFRVLVAAMGAVLILGLAGNVWPAVPEGETRAVAIVQGNSPCPGSICPRERSLIYESHLALTRALDPGPDLVVWPESSTGGPADPLRDPAVAQAIGAEASRLGSQILVGGDLDAGPDHFLNVNVVFGPQGDIVGMYHKRHPVPFGEYVPLRPLFEIIPALDRVPRDMIRGDRPMLFELDGIQYASVISYEGAYARYEREAMKAGASFLVLATNEASFGKSQASDHLLAMSRMRAAELGTDLVHAAVTGKSALVYADGRVEGVTELFEATTLEGEVATRAAGPTLYTRWGDWLQVVTMVAFIGLWLFSNRLWREDQE